MLSATVQVAFIKLSTLVGKVSKMRNNVEPNENILVGRRWCGIRSDDISTRSTPTEYNVNANLSVHGFVVWQRYSHCTPVAFCGCLQKSVLTRIRITRAHAHSHTSVVEHSSNTLNRHRKQQAESAAITDKHVAADVHELSYVCACVCVFVCIKWFEMLHCCCKDSRSLAFATDRSAIAFWLWRILILLRWIEFDIEFESRNINFRYSRRVKKKLIEWYTTYAPTIIHTHCHRCQGVHSKPPIMQSIYSGYVSILRPRECVRGYTISNIAPAAGER